MVGSKGTVAVNAPLATHRTGVQVRAMTDGQARATA